ncbi:MAG TPA: DUF488 domain-containing protein [Nitrospiraceae bacterium]|nr:DUF488 domain-containing protein [Nitrospiraceae bacterium]
MLIWTIGHSTRPIEEFIDLLRAHGIRVLVDVRRFPTSRRHPQFNAEPLAHSLQEAGMPYRHMPELGGRRTSRPDSVNLRWRSEGFRGYADYMQTDAFWSALGELMACGKSGPTVVMCAEAVPWRCHRSLIADALVSRGWTVRHILSAAEATPHRLTPFARIHEGKVMYPVE